MFESLVDFNIAIEIGYHQEHGTPLTLRQLSLRGIAASATVRQRLERLIRAGVVERSGDPSDADMAELSLTGEASRMFHGYLRQIGRLTGKWDERRGEPR